MHTFFYVGGTAPYFLPPYYSITPRFFLSKVLERLLALDAEIRTATDALGIRQQLKREIAETRAEIAGTFTNPVPRSLQLLLILYTS